MDKIKFKDLMDALNSKRYNVDKFAIIECYCATRFTIGQIRLLFASLSTSIFRYRALLVLIEYMPELDEQNALHIVNAVSECESHREIRLRTLKRLIESNKLPDPGLIESVYQIIGLSDIDSTHRDVKEIDLAIQVVSDNQTLESLELSYSQNTKQLPNASSNKDSRKQRFQDQRKYMLNNRIYPLTMPSRFEIEECDSASTLDAKVAPKCCFL